MLGSPLETRGSGDSFLVGWVGYGAGGGAAWWLEKLSPLGNGDPATQRKREKDSHPRRGSVRIIPTTNPPRSLLYFHN